MLRNATVLDEGGGFTGPIDLLALDGSVAARGARLDAPPDGVPTVDFSGLWVMPGVFDCHTHITASATAEAELLRTPMSRQVLETAQNLRRTLEGGVTFIRDGAGADAGIRDSVEAGYVEGPGMQVCINILSQTGGHGDRFLEGPGVDWDLVLQWPGRPPNVVDGVDEVRRVVRQLIRAGADWIKVCTSGGIVGTAREAGDLPEFTFDEVAVAVTEARKKRRGVMCHAHGGPGLTEAVEAGVTSIEHGLLLTEAQAAAMARGRLLARADADDDQRARALGRGRGGRAADDARPHPPQGAGREAAARSGDPDRQGCRRQAGRRERLHQPHAARPEPGGADADARSRSDGRGDAARRDRRVGRAVRRG